jgi:hypothetical protein
MIKSVLLALQQGFITVELAPRNGTPEADRSRLLLVGVIDTSGPKMILNFKAGGV